MQLFTKCVEIVNLETWLRLPLVCIFYILNSLHRIKIFHSKSIFKHFPLVQHNKSKLITDPFNRHNTPSMMRVLLIKPSIHLIFIMLVLPMSFIQLIHYQFSIEQTYHYIIWLNFFCFLKDWIMHYFMFWKYW